MAWSSVQKQLAVRACRAAGISEEQRVDMILRHFKRAHHAGAITSTAPNLTNRDFEAFMQIVERTAGGQVLHFTRDYWHDHAAAGLSRMQHRARRLAGALEAAGKLQSDGVGLAGWIEKRVSGGTARRVEELEYHGLLALIVGLQAYARQSAVKVEA